MPRVRYFAWWADLEIREDIYTQSFSKLTRSPRQAISLWMVEAPWYPFSIFVMVNGKVAWRLHTFEGPEDLDKWQNG